MVPSHPPLCLSAAAASSSSHVCVFFRVYILAFLVLDPRRRPCCRCRPGAPPPGPHVGARWVRRGESSQGTVRQCQSRRGNHAEVTMVWYPRVTAVKYHRSRLAGSAGHRKSPAPSLSRGK